MNFVQFLAILRARYKTALVVLAATVLPAIVLSLVLPKTYTAVASVVVDTTKPDPLAAVLYSGGLNPGVIATQMDIIQSDRVAFKVVKNLRLTENATLREQWQNETKGEGTMEQWLATVFQKQMDVKPSRESPTRSCKRILRPTSRCASSQRRCIRRSSTNAPRKLAMRSRRPRAACPIFSSRRASLPLTSAST
jgi:uncharacterized protein involved in exopolysaccharide biosynthesis